jgi:hypothetical protein
MSEHTPGPCRLMEKVEAAIAKAERSANAPTPSS